MTILYEIINDCIEEKKERVEYSMGLIKASMNDLNHDEMTKALIRRQKELTELNKLQNSFRSIMNRLIEVL